ncbi:uncharacterized protein A1O9_11553 [Exophiala aquamarina CBS 119918]|uniref:Glycosyltransferase family 31 protein n=1 Tax=Exophiala aquamarina CBS 119918 TaxID=1182545 RepID=A0A072NZ86_9EURO|nr:uncharacterized protein A1O9_11553 [Exophiala aquamarina CBS 119918]KEF52313.1 hypothetical protein A1O9_11553 [Exophiala aquamarina CBS 119918]
MYSDSPEVKAFLTWSKGEPNLWRKTPLDAPLADTDQYCKFFLDSKDVLIVVKTGANEIHDKLPTQLLTGLRCYQHILIFSDREQRIGPFVVHDALRNASDILKTQDPDFDYYRTLQDYKGNGEDKTSLRHKSGKAAWNLDKYKFLHMLEETWNLRPHRKWYIFIEADTYLVRTNLLLWLERQDPSQLLYFGSPTYVNGEAFAHGGSGVVLSGAALSKFANGDPGIAARYDAMVKSESFGDYVLMKALRDKGVVFSGRWPMLQAEKPATIPFGPGPDNGVRHWCQPIVTMHHITPEEACVIWDFEQQRKSPKVCIRHYRPWKANAS